jgi:hypothetical protein
MPSTSETGATPETEAQRLNRLIPVMGVENARRLVASRVSEEQREALGKLVASAPRRVSSDPLAGYNAGGIDSEA